MNLNNVPDCSTYQFVAFLGVYELECGPILSVVISSHKATFSTFFNFMNLFILKVHVKNKVNKVRTSQLWLQ